MVIFAPSGGTVNATGVIYGRRDRERSADVTTTQRKNGLSPEESFRALIKAIEGIEIDARWETREPLTVEFVANRLTGGDRERAEATLNALVAFDVLTVTEENSQTVYQTPRE